MYVNSFTKKKKKHIHLSTAFGKFYLNANIIKTQIFHKMKYDLRGH